MEQEIVLEGIHAMLEEIRDNLKKNPEVETIKSKLNAIEKVCNELTEQKFVTEDVLAQFLACTLQKIAEMNKKQEEKIGKFENYILKSNDYFNLQINKIIEFLIPMKNSLDEKLLKRNIIGRILLWIKGL